MKTKSIILCAVCAAVISVFSLITVNIGPVPVTLAIFAIFLVPIILGAKKGMISVAVYLLLGTAGLPIFAGFNSGFQRLIGPTGGYLWSYLVMALIIGLMTSKTAKNKRLALLQIFAACIAALAVCYALGTAQYMLVMSQGLWESLAACVAPFVIFDLIKAAAAAYIGYETKRALLKANLLEMPKSKDKKNGNAVSAETFESCGLSFSVGEEPKLTRAQALAILKTDGENVSELVSRAGALREKYKGKRVDIQLLTNVRSGNRSQDCVYCAQSCRSDADIDTYKWVDEDKLYGDDELVKSNGLSMHCMGLSGMKFTDAEIEELASRVRVMKKNGTRLCCSIGFLTEKQARMLKDAGVDRINHNLNTGRNHYSDICTTHTYQERLDNIHMLMEIGFEICCGGIIGMGESDEDIIDMLFDLGEIKPEAVPINFLIPLAGTPLENADTRKLTPEYCLKILCLARLIMPRADIRCAAGREIYFKGKEKELLTVVNSIFASGYLTAGGESVAETIKMVTDLGFTYTLDG